MERKQQILCSTLHIIQRALCFWVSLLEAVHIMCVHFFPPALLHFDANLYPSLPFPPDLDNSALKALFRSMRYHLRAVLYRSHVGTTMKPDIEFEIQSSSAMSDCR